MKTLKRAALITGILFSFVIILSRASAQNTKKLSDAEIASVAVVANQNDIDFAKMAKQKSHNSQVLEFANTMIADHQSVIDMATALVTKLKVTPKDNAVSQKYVADAKRTLQMLDAKSDKTFNKAYVDNEVSYHQTVIDAVNKVLIPQSQNAELKALLQKVVPILQKHLEHAQMLQKQIK